MTNDSLIEKLEKLKEPIYYVDGHPQLAPFSDKINYVIDQCISIIRQPQSAKAVEPSGDVVKHVAYHIEHMIPRDSYCDADTIARSAVRATIAAMGESSNRKAEGCVGTTGTADTANVFTSSPARATPEAEQPECQHEAGNCFGDGAFTCRKCGETYRNDQPDESLSDSLIEQTCRFCGKLATFTKDKYRQEHWDYCDVCMANIGRASYEQHVAALDVDNSINCKADGSVEIVQSEIPLAERRMLAKKIADELWEDGGTHYEDSLLIIDYALERLPYLGITEPVSLALCVAAINPEYDTDELVAKAVLDAAGVKYGK